MVDAVTWFEDEYAGAADRRVRPEVLAKGGDWPPSASSERRTFLRAAGE